MNKTQLEKAIEKTKKAMQQAAKAMDFMDAAQYRDELIKLENLLKEKSREK
jgi:excinuclease ABC subunit B